MTTVSSQSYFLPVDLKLYSQLQPLKSTTFRLIQCRKLPYLILREIDRDKGGKRQKTHSVGYLKSVDFTISFPKV